MTIPCSFSTICTYPCVQELIGLVLSLSIHHADSTLYVICDTKSRNYVENVLTPKPRICIKWRTTLDYATNKNRGQMEKEGIWTDFQMQKAVSMEWALQECDDVMFLDSDQFVVGRIDGIDKSKDIGVSPHFMPKLITDRYGYYNGGMLWTKNKTVPKRWIESSKTSRYYDQACIEVLAKEYSKFEFGHEYNIQSYRFTQGLWPMKTYMSKFKTSKGEVRFNNIKVRTFHTHFKKGDPMTGINRFIQGLLLRAKMWREASIVDRMLDTHWKLWIPKQPNSNPHWRHNNDSFRMYPKMWSGQNGDVKWGENSTRMNCWLGNSVMLYDRPTLQWMNKETSLASLVLIGNGGRSEIVDTSNKWKTNVKSWIFWPRDIQVYMKHRTNKSWKERSIETIFIGNFENAVQQKFRSPGDWNKYVQEFHLTGGHKHKFTKEQYVRKLGQSKYGLCLRGFGKKCHREVELMGLGTVPIVAKDVEMDSYANRLIEGVHYIRVESPKDIVSKIKQIGELQWKKMSDACIEWFDQNMSWESTIRRIVYN